jgi:hypothetical protein
MGSFGNYLPRFSRIDLKSPRENLPVEQYRTIFFIQKFQGGKTTLQEWMKHS